MKHLSSSVTSLAYKVTQTVIGVECDVCHKVIPADKRGWADRTGRYFEVTTGHRDWGNDSCESVQTLDICPECLTKYVADYFEKMRGSNTAYLEITTEVSYPEESSCFLKDPPKEGETFTVRHDWL